MKYFLLALITFFALFFNSCNDNLAHNPSDIIFPDSNVSFQQHVQPVIMYNCSYSGCHSDDSRAGGLRITDYYSYFETQAIGLVIPGNPDASRLIQIVETPSYHIPYIIWQLNANHKAGLRKWIEEGAANN
jgi:hypothetical protein